MTATPDSSVGEDEPVCIHRFMHNFANGDAPESAALTFSALIEENEGNERYLTTLVEDVLEDGRYDNSDDECVIVYTALDRDELETRWQAHKLTDTYRKATTG